MAQRDDWADDFVLDRASLSRLHAWVVFHYHAHNDSAFVPPIPPMVLQMLNRASIEVCWTLDVNEDTSRATHAQGETPLGERTVAVKALCQPNWWRTFALTRDPDPEWFAALGLRMRRLRACYPVTSVTYLSGSRSLVDLNLSETEMTSEGLDGLGCIPTLTKLSLRWCVAVTSASCLRASCSLVELDLSETGIPSEGLKGLEHIPTLKKLNLSWCETVRSASCLGGSTSLVDLDLSGTKLTSAGLEGVERIPTLRILNLSRCGAITSVACLGASTSLIELDLSSCWVPLEGLEGLERIPTLTKLNLRGCPVIKSVAALLNRFPAQIEVIPPE